MDIKLSYNSLNFIQQCIDKQIIGYNDFKILTYREFK